MEQPTRPVFTGDPRNDDHLAHYEQVVGEWEAAQRVRAHLAKAGHAADAPGASADPFKAAFDARPVEEEDRRGPPGLDGMNGRPGPPGPPGAGVENRKFTMIF